MRVLGFMIAVPALLIAFAVSAAFKPKPKIRWIAAGVAGSLTIGAALALVWIAAFAFFSIDWDPDPRPALWLTNTSDETIFLGFDGAREPDPAVPLSSQRIEVFLNPENVIVASPNPGADPGSPTFLNLRPDCSSDTTLSAALAVSPNGTRLNRVDETQPTPRQNMPEDIELIHEFDVDFCPFTTTAHFVWNGEELSERSTVPIRLTPFVIFLILPLAIGLVLQLVTNRMPSQDDGPPPPQPPPPPPPPQQQQPPPPPPAMPQRT